MLTEVTYNQEKIKKLIQADLKARYGPQFKVDTVMIMDEDHETTIHDFEVWAQVQIFQVKDI